MTRKSTVEVPVGNSAWTRREFLRTTAIAAGGLARARHPPLDDVPGRRIGIEVGNAAYDFALDYFD